jgi:hypothetical protein
VSVRSIEAGRVVDLFKEGIEIVKPNWLMFAVGVLLIAVIAGAVGRIPMLGPIISPLVSVPLSAGFMLLIRDSANRQPFDFAKFFAAFQNTPMLINLLIVAAPQCVLGIVQAIGLQMGSLTLVLLVVPVALAYAVLSLFAVPRIVFGGTDGVTALKESVAGVLGNIVGVILFVILAIVAAFVGVLALIIGLFFVAPVIAAALVRFHDEVYGYANTMPSAPPMAPPPPPGAPGW